MKLIIIVLLLTFAGQGIALASSSSFECDNIRLDVDGVMAQLPVFDQAGPDWNQDTNICYAAAAAQLVDAFRLQKSPAKKKQPISPWWVATNYSTLYKKADEGLEFGEIAKALQAMKDKGVCSQEDLFADLKPEKVVHFYHLLKEYFTKNSLGKPAHAGSNEKLSALLKESEFTTDSSLANEMSHHARHATTFVSFVESLLGDKCKGKISTEDEFNFQRIEFDRSGLSRQERARLIHSTLRATQPLEASICSQMLREPGYRGVSAQGAYSESCLRHSVMVIGSRKNQGQCDYLVRDMYGAGSCSREINGKPWYNPALECTGGQLWISQKLLLDNAWGLTRISLPPQAQNLPLPPTDKTGRAMSVVTTEAAH